MRFNTLAVEYTIIHPIYGRFFLYTEDDKLHVLWHNIHGTVDGKLSFEGKDARNKTSFNRITPAAIEHTIKRYFGQDAVPVIMPCYAKRIKEAYPLIKIIGDLDTVIYCVKHPIIGGLLVYSEDEIYEEPEYVFLELHNYNKWKEGRVGVIKLPADKADMMADILKHTGTGSGGYRVRLVDHEGKKVIRQRIMSKKLAIGLFETLQKQGACITISYDKYSELFRRF